ncbi:MAG: GNAT family N-acetyltransferase [bacterium]
MEIVKYTEEWKQKWDAFVLRSNNGTLFHLQKFFDYHTPGKFAFHHLMFIENDKIVALLPGELKEGRFESPVGASYGSIVTSDIKFSHAMDLVSTLLEYGRSNGIKSFMLTAAPFIYEKYPSQNLDFAMLWQGFRYETHYISSAIQIDPSREIIKRFQTTVRYNVRKTLRDDSLRVEVNDAYDAFHLIILKNLSKHQARPTHSYEDLLRLKSLLPDRLKLFVVYHKDKAIGGSLLFLCNKQVALCFYNMMLYEYAAYKPIHRVMYEVVRWAEENGYRYVDIGVSQDTAAANPMTPNMNLIAFKETFDAKAVMRNTLIIEL